MDLTSDKTFSVTEFSCKRSYPSLTSDAHTEVLVLGGGISGALMAHYLVRNGVNCLICDKRDVGMGSTSASTSLLLYELDDPIVKLSRKIGLKKSDQLFKACVDSVYKLEEIASEVGLKEFQRRKSLYFNGSAEDIQMIGQEYKMRKQLGFAVSLLAMPELEKDFGLVADAAILSDCGAQTDAYLLTHTLHHRNQREMGGVFSKTKVINLEFKPGKIVATTENGHRIFADFVIHATGYEAQEYFSEKIVNLQSTYVTCAKLKEDENNFCNDAIYWNSADPYVYLRCANNMILFGGEDEEFYNPELRDSLLPAKEKILTKTFRQLFPGVTFQPEYSWCGTFGTTDDGLPYIGSYGDARNYFMLGFGGNGIVFSQIAAEILTDAVRGKAHALKNHFAFGR